jgi:hypothetical protein
MCFTVPLATEIAYFQKMAPAAQQGGAPAARGVHPTNMVHPPAAMDVHPAAFGGAQGWSP